MTKFLYLVLLAAVVWKAYGDDSDEDIQDITGSTQNDDREIKCGKHYAQYPNPENCSTYIVCQNGQKTIKSCPRGEHYSFQTVRCEDKCKAYCNKTLSCECKWPTCGLDDVCFLDQIVGGCANRMTRYFFNKRTGQCERFGYSGCRGNENNFKTIEECQQKCRKGKPKPRFDCLTLNGLFPNPDNCNTFFQCSNGDPHLMDCPKGLHYSDKTKRCERPCDAYCESSLSCKCKWPTCGMDDLCFLPPETGDCRAAFRHYYFNRRTGQCEQFTWGGCGGNKNNFKKKEECERVCNKGKGECTEHERFTECGAACQRTCKNYKHEVIPCPFICRRGCVCEKGFARSSKGQCVPDAECENDNSEGTGEEESVCKTANEFIPDEKNCRRFIQCVNFRPIKKECRPGTAFDPKMHKCTREQLEMCRNNDILNVVRDE